MPKERNTFVLVESRDMDKAMFSGDKDIPSISLGQMLCCSFALGLGFYNCFFFLNVYSLTIKNMKIII
jgi:hypothetical protein